MSARMKVARVAGGFYVIYIVASIVSGALGQIGIGSTEQIYNAVSTNPDSFRVALVVALVSGFLFFMAAWGLYVLLRPVNPDLALLLLVLNAIGVAIQGSCLLSLVSLIVPGTLSESAALVSIGTYKLGFVTAQVFFCTWLFPLGYLVFKSGFLPKVFGVLLVLDAFAVMIWFLQAFLLPDLSVIRYPGLALSFIAEVGLALWLLVRGASESAPAQAGRH